MTIEEKQKFRREILKLHYELSEGNSLNLVMRPMVAEKLGFKEDYNNDELLGAINYLEDKGFLRVQTNVQDQITDSGIDEVENGFLNFPLKEDEESGNEDEGEELESELIVLLREINDCYEKGEKGTLKKEKLEECENRVKIGLEQFIPQLGDEDLPLQLEKLRSNWHLPLKSGFHDKKLAIERLGKYEEFIKKIIEKITGEIPRSEAFISEGQSYEGRKTLRLIIRQAKQKIWLIDNFMHPEILIVTEPYLIENPDLELRLLMRQKNNSNFRSFQSDFLKFVKQYPQMKLEARENNQCHGRFIIVDEKIYHSGHSLHALGDKADAINLIQINSNQQKILHNFDDWWNNGNIVK
ncbi:MAG: hypothetical protein NTY11_02620 [Candidatus Parcubacteria bacterium]|nr:hypothetical protein [Candidatus Parcubacteria bacterium]